MRLTIDDADSLVLRAMCGCGFSPGEARIITDQIIGCELRGVSHAGLSRALSLIERKAQSPDPAPMRITRETPVSALIDGGDRCGYLVASHAVETGIAKAREAGVAVIGANNTWYTGMYAHYLETAAEAGLVAMAAGSSAPRVAPHGASEGRFGTNPIAFAFPSQDDPVIFDSGTSAIVIAQAVMARRMDELLPPDVAFAPDGSETRDPDLALAGALKPWGGHRGAGLGIVVQLLGILAGGGAMPEDYRDCGFFFMALRPDLFMDADDFRRHVSNYAAAVRAARPVDGAGPVRMPFDRSAETRRQILARGAIEAPESVVAALRELAGPGGAPPVTG